MNNFIIITGFKKVRVKLKQAKIKDYSKNNV